MGLFKTIAAGGQTWAHRIRMLRQVIKIGFLVAVVPTLAYLGWFLYSQPIENYKAFYYFGMAKISFEEKVTVDAQSWKEIERPLRKNPKNSINTTFNIVSASQINDRLKNNTIKIKKERVIDVCQKRVSFFLQELLVAAKLAGKNFLAFFSLCMIFFLWRGKKTKQKEFISGSPRLSPWRLKLNLHLKFKASDLKIGGVPLLKGKDPEHIMITGCTRSGKTNCMRGLLKQIRARGDRAVIVDTTGSFVSEFYEEESDILMNPYDKRSKPWHPWCECPHLDFEKLSLSFIPKPAARGEDDFFSAAARAIFLASLENAVGEKNFLIEEFLDQLLRASNQELLEKLQDTDAAIYLDPKGERTTASVRSTLNNFIAHLRPLTNTVDPFSIREWILSGEEGSALFLASDPSKREKLRTLISVWFSTALSSVMERGVSKENKLIWLVVDELHSLQKLEYLQPSLSEIAKYKGCLVLATQNLAQLDEIYGIPTTKSMIDQCGTKVCFRQNESAIAKRMSSFFGEVQTRETQEGISYGANEIRDGVNLSSVERTRPSVSTSDILSLKNLEAFLKLPGNIPPTKVKFEYLEEKQIAESYIEDPEIFRRKKASLEKSQDDDTTKDSNELASKEESLVDH